MPIAGRALDAQDTGVDVAVISYDASRRRFGESAPVGRVLRLDGRPYTIVGVMSRVFAFPSRDIALWTPRVPLAAEAEFPGARFYHMIARLKGGATLEQAQAEATVATVRMLVVSGLAPAAAGLAVGLAAALGVSRLATALLFGVRPTDPLTYVAAAVAMVLVAALAITAPALRAVRIDPALALRGEQESGAGR